MKKLFIIALLGAFLFCGPLFENFKEGVGAANEKVGKYIRGEFCAESMIGFWLKKWIDENCGEVIDWDGKDTEELARKAGVMAYCNSLKATCERMIKHNQELGFLPKFLNNGDIWFAYRLQCERSFIDVHDNFDAYSDSLWRFKKYGVGGVSWKNFVLGVIEASKKPNKRAKP